MLRLALVKTINLLWKLSYKTYVSVCSKRQLTLWPATLLRICFAAVGVTSCYCNLKESILQSSLGPNSHLLQLVSITGTILMLLPDVLAAASKILQRKKIIDQMYEWYTSIMWMAFHQGQSWPIFLCFFPRYCSKGFRSKNKLQLHFTAATQIGFLLP